MDYCSLCKSEPSDECILDGETLCAGCYEEEVFYQKTDDAMEALSESMNPVGGE